MIQLRSFGILKCEELLENRHNHQNSEIDQIKMTKRNLIQSRRRCYVAKTRESLGPYWTPRYGPKCTSHIEADHATVPLKNCHPEHIQGKRSQHSAFFALLS